MNKVACVIFFSILITGCSATFYSANLDQPQAGLRVATDMSGNTSFNIGSRSSCKEKDFALGLLGWFHPAAGSMQAGRRGTDKRIGLKGGDKYRSNMQAEHFVNVSEPTRFHISNISGFTYGVVSTLNSCNGFYDIKITADKNYEIFASKNKDGCSLEVFELIEENGNVSRRELEAVRACN